jgi:transposase-like protein
MSHGRPRDPRKEQQWRRWLVQFQHSGLSVRAFCARHGLSPQSFYAWRRQIRQRDAAADPFVAVQLVAADEPARVASFEVVLAGGRTLRVPPGFDATALRQLLAVLQEVQPC